MGSRVGLNNTTGSYNNFLGLYAGFSNTTGNYNNFLGRETGTSNTTGQMNNFIGFGAGRFNTTGSYNNFFGRGAGRCNSTGGNNNFLGNYAGRSNSIGSNNNFFGINAGCFNSTGSNNIFIGNNANTASAQVSALSGVIVLGRGAVATESHQIVLSTANVSFKSTGNIFEIGSPDLSGNLTVYGGLSVLGPVSPSLIGPQGIQGIQGLSGAQGIQGIQGLSGAQGIQGIQGLSGAQGIQGLSGEPGAQGIQGIQGLSGAQGIPGLSASVASISSIPVTIVDISTSRIFTDSDINKIFHFDTTSASLCAIIPSSLTNGFNVSILNTGTNNIQVSAADLKSTGTTIIDQYGGAYIYKQNNTVFAVGRLY